MKSIKWPGFVKNEKGASLLELAIVTPFLLVLVIGIVEFGWIFAGYISVTGAAREGARNASMGQETALVIEAVETHAKNFTEVQKGTILDIVIPADYPAGIAMGEEVAIEVYGEISSLTSLFSGSGGVIPFPLIQDPFPLHAKVSMRKVIESN